MIRAPPCIFMSLPTIWRPCSPPLTPIPMRKACPPMCSVHGTTPCRAASWLHGVLRLGCDTCHKELLLPFSCKRGGFVRRVPVGAWPRPPPTWLRGSSPGCQYANGSCRCLSLAVLDGRVLGISPRRSIRSSVPRSGSIMCIRRSPVGSHSQGPTGVSDVYPAIRHRHQPKPPLSLRFS